ncbi:MAG: SDH family Clp fold serine proteinase [Acidaminococcaceae bacterium]
MAFDFSQLLLIIFIMMTVWPMMKKKALERSRYSFMQKFEKVRGTRCITLIHRQEAISLFGLPISRYIDIEDSEQVLRAIRFTPDDMPIDIILHTPGGLLLATEQIALALLRHPAKVTVFVPHYAMSGGTMIALAADEIVMDENAVLGPVDPQVGQFPAVAVLNAVSRKNVNRIDDSTLIMADIAEKAVKQVEASLVKLLKDKLPPERVSEFAKELSAWKWTHDYPIFCDELRQMGLNVNVNVPDLIYDLMELYPQPVQRMPSVQYIPLPYEKKDTRKA